MSVIQHICALAGALLISACGDESSAPVEKNVDAANSAIENSAKTPAKKLSGGKADVEFGSEALAGFSTIKCWARPEKSRFSVTASGKYQGERVRVVVRPISGRQGAVALNIRGEMWQLLEGEVQATEDGKRFTASGTLRGKRMDRQEDGTSKLVPLEGEDIKPFRITIKCP